MQPSPSFSKNLFLITLRFMLHENILHIQLKQILQKKARIVQFNKFLLTLLQLQFFPHLAQESYKNRNIFYNLLMGQYSCTEEKSRTNIK